MVQPRCRTLSVCRRLPSLLPWLLAISVLLRPSGAAGSASPAKSTPRPPEASPSARPLSPGPLILEDKPEPLVPERPPTEGDQDRVEALVLFSAARLRERRWERSLADKVSPAQLQERQRDLTEALRLYQRAFRCDPQSAAIARAIVAIAAYLDRNGEAVRYAVKLVELEDADPLLLKRLGVYLTDNGDWPGALALYEKADAARKDAKPTADDVPLWLETGRLYHLTERYDRAADQFARVIHALEHPEQFGLSEKAKKAIFGEAGLTWNLFGESFLLAGRFPEAAAAFEKGHRAAPNKGLLSYQLARIDARTGKPEKALDRLQACFDARLASEGVAPYRLLADLLKTLHKENELIGRLEAARKADPDNPFLGHFLAEQYLKARQADKAEAAYRELIAKSPSISGYRELLEIYRKAKRYDALLKVLGEAISHVGALEPLAEKGRPLADDKDLVQGALATARAQLKTDPKGFPYESRLAAAVLALEAKQYDATAEFYNAAIQAKPDQAARLLLSWGLGLSLREQHARAVEVYRRGLDQKALPADDPTFHYYLAGALEMAGRTEEALAAARKAAELAAARPPAGKPAKLPQARHNVSGYQSRVAWILYHGKRYREAAKAYEDLVRTHASDYTSTELREVLREARLGLSNIAVIQKDNARATDWLQQVLDEFPDDPGALNDLGYLWAEQGKHLDRAFRMIRIAVDKEPDNAAYRDSLGWVLFQKGRVNEALPELEKAAAKEPDPTVLDHLGDAYRALSQPQKAKDAWRRAVEAFQKDPDPEKIKRIGDKIKSIS